MKNKIMLFIILIFVSACGAEKSSVPDLHFTNTSYSNQAIFLQKKSVSCEIRSFREEDSTFRLQIYQAGRNFLRQMNFFRLLSGIFLRDGKVIERSTYNEKVEVLQSQLGEKILQAESGSDIFVCPEESYESDSVESAALNATHFIEKTRKFFQNASPGIKISPVQLSISPAILKSRLVRNFDGSVTKVSSYMTDNAYYKSSTRTIAFLPQSEFMRNNGFQVNLWEVPMVPSHEYGHHLFQELLGPKLQPPHGVSGCFGGEVPERTQQKSFRGRQVKIEDVVRSMHEGFADLVAFYSLLPSERSVEGVRCLEVSRDVVSPVFYDGYPKRFSEEALRSYFSIYQKDVSSCDVTNYQDAHTMGAVLAYTFNNFLSEFTDSDEEKLAALIEWVKFLRSESTHLRKKNPEVFLKDSYREFLKISAGKFNRTFDDKLCRKIDELFPALKIKECSQ